MRKPNQELVRKYFSYGFKMSEIEKELHIDRKLIKSYLYPKKQGADARKAKTMSIPTKPVVTRVGPDKFLAQKILYNYSVYTINDNLKKHGITKTARHLGIKRSLLFCLVRYFGCSKMELPRNAKDRIVVWQDDILDEVDKRDNFTCVRCGKQCKQDPRYLKIKHPGPMVVDNCITTCRRCMMLIRRHITFRERRHIESIDQLKTIINTKLPYHEKNVPKQFRKAVSI